jgi:hypothetical protein
MSIGRLARLVATRQEGRGGVVGRSLELVARLTSLQVGAGELAAGDSTGSLLDDVGKLVSEKASSRCRPRREGTACEHDVLPGGIRGGVPCLG